MVVILNYVLIFWRRLAVIFTKIDSAISYGEIAPMSTPAGALSAQDFQFG
jgi:hypothetical protein